MQEIRGLWETHLMSYVCCDRMGRDKAGNWKGRPRMARITRIRTNPKNIRVIRAIRGYGLLPVLDFAVQAGPSESNVPRLDRHVQWRSAAWNRARIRLPQTTSSHVRPPQAGSDLILTLYAHNIETGQKAPGRVSPGHSKPCTQHSQLALSVPVKSFQIKPAQTL